MGRWRFERDQAIDAQRTRINENLNYLGFKEVLDIAGITGLV